MAIYIQIRKRAEDDSIVTYDFGPSDELIGSITIDKTTGAIDLLHISGDREEFYVPRISRVLRRLFDAGDFPDETCYAA